MLKILVILVICEISFLSFRLFDHLVKYFLNYLCPGNFFTDNTFDFSDSFGHTYFEFMLLDLTLPFTEELREAVSYFRKALNV